MIIGIVGANGCIGKSLVTRLKLLNHKIVEITRANFESLARLNAEFDLLINCNGNSSKRVAEKEPAWDLDLSVKTLYKILNSFKSNRYINISSIDAMFPSTYGLHKTFAEAIIAQNCPNSTSIRCGAIVGENISKGLVRDITCETTVYLSRDSKVQLLHVDDLANFIIQLMTLGQWEPLYNCWSPDNVSPDEVGEILKKKVNYGDDLKYEFYDYDSENKLYPFMTCKKVLDIYKKENNE